MATQAASPQSVSNTGDHNIIVQAHGDGINITVGLPYLALVPWSSRVRSRELGLEPDEELLLPYRTLIEALIAEIKLRPEEGDPE